SQRLFNYNFTARSQYRELQVYSNLNSLNYQPFKMQRTNPVRALLSTKKYYANALQTGGRPFTGTSLPEKRAATTGVSKAVKARRIIDDEGDTTKCLLCLHRKGTW